VVDIKINDSSTQTCLYRAVPINKLNLALNSTWLVDTKGKFNVGDTLSFQLSQPNPPTVNNN